MQKLLIEVVEDIDFLIREMAHTYDNDELYRLSGRVYELTKIKNKLKEIEILGDLYVE